MLTRLKYWSDRQTGRQTDGFQLYQDSIVVNHEVKKKQYARASSAPHYHYSELLTRIAAINF